MEYLKEDGLTDSDSSDEEEAKCNGGQLSTTPTPRFEITQRKFEIMDLFGTFFNKHFKNAFLVLLAVTTFSSLWSYVTVVGVALATKIPFHYIQESLRCSDDAFHHRLLPEGDCLYAYYLSIVLFAVVVVILSMLDLKEQAVFQVLFGILRLFSICAIVVYCVTSLIQGGDSCVDSAANSTGTNIDIESVILKFDPKGWLQSVPVILFGFLFMMGIPAMVQIIKQKEHLAFILTATIVIATILYSLLGLAGALWFRANIEENCVQNWVRGRTQLALFPIFQLYLSLCLSSFLFQFPINLVSI